MSATQQNRRDFLKASAATAATFPFWFPTQSAQAFRFESPNERPVIGCVGTGSRWDGVGPAAVRFGDCIAVCDVDANHAEKARQKVKELQGQRGVERDVAVHEDYRQVVENDEVDVVVIVTPDHWHTKIAIDAMRAGKDVFCEKPLTLTIEEGKQIIRVLEETGRVFQVGTQQRSEFGLRFLQAVALVKEGRLGDVTRVQCAIGGAPASPSLQVEPVPEHLNWDMWLGQAPLVEYIPRRCHYEFRWWYEYSGGKMTDWGAHHVDIAQWAIGMDQSGPLRVEPVSAVHPVPFENGHPTVDNQYNTATEFLVKALFPNGVEMVIRHDTDNGILIEGTQGRIFVGRGALRGKPVEDLEENPLPEDAISKLYRGKEPGDHMRNFFECLVTREQPISDVHTHHRAMTTCHLANIALRLGRTLEWDPETEQITNDSEANTWQAREQRQGYEIEV